MPEIALHRRAVELPRWPPVRRPVRWRGRPGGRVPGSGLDGRLRQRLRRRRVRNLPAKFPEYCVLRRPGLASLGQRTVARGRGLSRRDGLHDRRPPVCQSFSHNNHQRNAVDARARLFEQYLTLVEALWPKTIVMEKRARHCVDRRGWRRPRDSGAARLDGLRRALRARPVSRGVRDAAGPPPRLCASKGRRRADAQRPLVAALLAPGMAVQRPEGATARPVTVWQAIGDLPIWPTAAVPTRFLGTGAAPRLRTSAVPRRERP